MFASIVFGIIIPLLLVIGGGISVARGIIALRQGPHRRTVGVLLLVAGIGTLALTFLALAPWVGWSDMDYGALVLPLVALAIAAVLNLVLLVPAAIIGRRSREQAPVA